MSYSNPTCTAECEECGETIELEMAECAMHGNGFLATMDAEILAEQVTGWTEVDGEPVCPECQDVEAPA